MNFLQMASVGLITLRVNNLHTLFTCAVRKTHMHKYMHDMYVHTQILTRGLLGLNTSPVTMLELLSQKHVNFDQGLDSFSKGKREHISENQNTSRNKNKKTTRNAKETHKKHDLISYITTS